MEKWYSEELQNFCWSQDIIDDKVEGMTSAGHVARMVRMETRASSGFKSWREAEVGG